MNLDNLEEELQRITADLNEESFIFDLLLAYEQPKASITRLRKGDYNLAEGTSQLLWKKKLFFMVEKNADLHATIDDLKNNSKITKNQPRFIIVTDFRTLLSIDTKTEESLDIPLQDLSKHYDFFLPWAGLEKSQIQGENPADVKAAEKMGRLYDLIVENNPPQNVEERHSLNIFLSRLLFCFFAEDTKIFDENIFTNSIASHTTEDGSDLQAYLQKLFSILNTEDNSSFPSYLQKFPYVNGGLFADERPVPAFNAKSRKIILECGGLNWKAINPDIFGSMIQAVVHPDERGDLGMHYTSVVNIMKVIEPLFLNDLKEELENAGDDRKALEAFLERLQSIHIFDPACGSGNFLIICFKELCKLEMEAYKRMLGGDRSLHAMSKIQLTQFYGIELDDFAHETAKLSLWLAEHQMNLAFKEVFGNARPTLPLKEGGHIVCGNATRLDWDKLCPKEEEYEIFILGNPPYLGGKYQSKTQKKDMEIAFGNIKNIGHLDYIACWFIKASHYISGINASFCFVTTSSICQGSQVHQLWPLVFELNLQIIFAHKPFKWKNNAKGNAQITCSIIGISNESNSKCQIFASKSLKIVDHINAYLISGSKSIVYPSLKPVSHLPPIITGNSPYDGGFLILSSGERERLVNKYPESLQFTRKVLGSKDFLSGKERWCLWIDDSQFDLASSIPEIKTRISQVNDFRCNGGEVARKLSNRPHQFRYRHTGKYTSIIIPRVSSERRNYIPIGFLDNETIILDSAQAIYDPPPWIFGIISSRIHATWVRTLAGRLKTDLRYSSALCYNTFPCPKISKSTKLKVEEHVFAILDERENYSEKTIAELYDPDKMPDGLRNAHHEMDLAVEQCYRRKPFTSDEERLEYLFKLYEKMIEAERNQ